MTKAVKGKRKFPACNVANPKGLPVTSPDKYRVQATHPANSEEKGNMNYFDKAERAAQIPNFHAEIVRLLEQTGPNESAGTIAKQMIATATAYARDDDYWEIDCEESPEYHEQTAAECKEKALAHGLDTFAGRSFYIYYMIHQTAYQAMIEEKMY